jgi:hypothetical protein
MAMKIRSSWAGYKTQIYPVKKSRKSPEKFPFVGIVGLKIYAYAYRSKYAYLSLSLSFSLRSEASVIVVI